MKKTIKSTKLQPKDDVMEKTIKSTKLRVDSALEDRNIALMATNERLMYKVEELEQQTDVMSGLLMEKTDHIEQLEAQLSNTSEAFNEAIAFSLDADWPRSLESFLSYWNYGEWDVLRRNWPEFVIHKSLIDE